MTTTEETYTYTARSVQHPERVVTFTLHGDGMSVGAGAPLELITQAAEAVEAVPEDNGEGTGETSALSEGKIWLRPLAVSLAQRGAAPFRIRDVDAAAEEDNLEVRGWFRVGGLRLVPITLMNGRVDNPAAAAAFVDELAYRKEGESSLLGFLDYWATWVLAALALSAGFAVWRHRAQSEAA